MPNNTNTVRNDTGNLSLVQPLFVMYSLRQRCARLARVLQGGVPGAKQKR